MTIFERIKELADKQGKSLQKVSEELGFSSNYLYQLKRQTPAADKLALIADYFHVSVDYLLGRTEYKSFRDMRKSIVSKIQNGEKVKFSELDFNHSEKWLYTMNLDLAYLNKELTESKVSFADESPKGYLVVWLDLIIATFINLDSDIKALQIYSDLFYNIYQMSEHLEDLDEETLAIRIGKESLAFTDFYNHIKNNDISVD